MVSSNMKTFGFILINNSPPTVCEATAEETIDVAWEKEIIEEVDSDDSVDDLMKI